MNDMTPLAAAILTDYAETKPTPILGLRSPIERAAEVERLWGFAPGQRGWWQQDCRIADMEALRDRLAGQLVPVRLDTMDKVFEARRQWERIDRICKAAMRGM